MRNTFVICSGCGRKLFDTAVCVSCENKRGREKEEAYQRLFKDICRVIEAAGLNKKKQIHRKPAKKKKNGNKSAKR